MITQQALNIVKLTESHPELKLWFKHERILFSSKLRLKSTVASLGQRRAPLFTSHGSSTALTFHLTKVKRDLIQSNIPYYNYVVLYYNCPLCYWINFNPSQKL